MKLQDWVIELCEFILQCDEGEVCEFPVDNWDLEYAEELMKLMEEGVLDAKTKENSNN